MKYRLPLSLIIASFVTTVASAQDAERTTLPPKFSYFTGGFALLFFAVFLFSFCFKMVRNLKTQKDTGKQMVLSSLKTAFLAALILIIGIYIYLNSGL